MSIEKEIRSHLVKEVKELDSKARDIDLIMYYYGFKDALWPTLDDAAYRFNVGTTEGRRTEAARQIVKSKFKDLTTIGNLPSLRIFATHLASTEVHFFDELQNFAKSANLFDAQVNIVGLVRLLHDLNVNTEYDMYSVELNKLTKPALNSGQTFLIVNDSSLQILSKALRTAKTIPGKIGIARLEYLKSDNIARQVNFELLLKLIKLNPDSWVYDDKYYLFESRENTIINRLEKIRSLTEIEYIDRLADILYNSLFSRSAPNSREYPPQQVIRAYLLNSKYIEVNEGLVRINIEPQRLSEIEQQAVDYINKKNCHDFSLISNYLYGFSHAKSTIDKAILNSPLIFVDKSEGWGGYKYYVVGSNVSDPNDKLSRYENYRQKLINVSPEGTDGSVETIKRNEHHILSQWLFNGKTQEKCAICGKLYSVNSLVTAHKKKRVECTDSERRDPHIVMPLCVFGCDYVYEKRLIYIDAGTVRASPNLKKEYYSELDYIATIEGNHLLSIWLEGSNSYFE